MKMQWVTFITFSLLLSCNNTKQTSEDQVIDLKIDSSLINAIDDYIEEHPIRIKYGKNLDDFYKEGFSHPSYHLYFDKKEKDTILTIALFPELHTFELGEYKGETDTIIYTIYPKGFFNYKNNNPIVIFDKKSIANKFYNKQILHSIPDTLISTNTDDIRDYKIDKWTYRIKDGKVLNKIN